MKTKDKKIVGLSPKILSEKLGCARGTVVAASKRAGVGVWTESVFKGKKGYRLVAIPVEDIEALKAKIHKMPGNPNWINERSRPRTDLDNWTTIKTERE